MQDSVLTQLALPLIIALIMFGMGLSLTLKDFSRILLVPKAVLVGLLGQILLLPILAWAVAVFFALPPALAIGLMIVAACPGGTMSNAICHAARANLALSVSMTAVSTVICIVTTPIIITWSIGYFGQQPAKAFSISSATVTLLCMTLVPVALGLFIKQRFTPTADYLEPYFRRFSGAFVILMIIAIAIEERNTLLASFENVFLAALSLHLVAIGVGLLLAFISRLNAIDGVTLGIEVGIQNAALAIVIGVTLLKQPDYAISAGVYGVTMYIGAGLLALLAKKSQSH